MAKKREDHPETVAFTDTALAIVASGNGWAVAKIPVDPVSGVTGEMELVPAGATREEAQERFKIMAVVEGIIR